MSGRWRLCLLVISAALFAAGDQSWKDKQIPQWTEEDAKQILTDSPWSKAVAPTMKRAANNGQRRSGMGGGIGLPGIGIGLPGMGGMGRRGGMGGGRYPRGGQPGTTDPGTNPDSLPTLTLRWESALPVREAELKAHETNAPTVDENYYAVAVYGIPSRMANGDPQRWADELKKQAAIKRDGKKDLKPSKVEVLAREDGPVILYLFPRTTEFTKEDNRVSFDGQIGRLQVEQPFYLDEMVYQGKREL